MADGIFFKNQNAAFNKLFKDLDKYTKELVAELDAEMGAGLEEMALEAKTKVPVDTGLLRNSINVVKKKELSYDLRADARYAAYVEFGTGPAAAGYVPSLDEDWQKYASSFKTNKEGHTPQQPFFYPSVNKVFPQMVKRMEDIIEK